MLTINALYNLKNNDGLTLRKGNAINYKSGWQVATEGVECANAQEAFEAIKNYNFTCGVWFADGVYYIDKSKRVDTKKEALEIGRACKQISILGWRKMNLVYC